MPETVVVRVAGARLEVRKGTSAAVAAIIAGLPCRTSVGGQARAPLCGMGICFECRMKIDGRSHVKSCQVVCSDGMEIDADE